MNDIPIHEFTVGEKHYAIFYVGLCPHGGGKTIELAWSSNIGFGRCTYRFEPEDPTDPYSCAKTVIIDSEYMGLDFALGVWEAFSKQLAKMPMSEKYLLDTRNHVVAESPNLLQKGSDA